jgi:hypothetical protein
MQRMTHSFTRNMTDTPFIYFGGDSYMAGDELADDTLQCWKDMFGTYPDKTDARYFKEFREAKMKEMHDWSDSRYQQYLCCQRDRVWTTLVCDKHGINHYNDGEGGSSQESMLHRAVIAFDKFEREGTVPTLAIIHLTNPSRITVYNDEVSTAPRGRYRFAFESSYAFNHYITDNNDPIGKYMLAHMDVESEKGNIIRWLTTLAITNSFFKEKTGRYPIYLESKNMAVRGYVKKAQNTVSPEYQSLIHQARLYAIDSNVWDLGHKQHLICPGGHHTPQTHANFAQFIAPHLLQELNRKEI